MAVSAVMMLNVDGGRGWQDAEIEDHGEEVDDILAVKNFPPLPLRSTDSSAECEL